MLPMGLGHFPEDFSLKENANNVEIEAGLMKQCLLSRSWIDTILCYLEAGLMKEIVK